MALVCIYCVISFHCEHGECDSVSLSNQPLSPGSWSEVHCWRPGGIPTFPAAENPRRHQRSSQRRAPGSRWVSGPGNGTCPPLYPRRCTLEGIWGVAKVNTLKCKVCTLSSSSCRIKDYRVWTQTTNMYQKWELKKVSCLLLWRW